MISTIHQLCQTRQLFSSFMLNTPELWNKMQRNILLIGPMRNYIVFWLDGDCLNSLLWILWAFCVLHGERGREGEYLESKRREKAAWGAICYTEQISFISQPHWPNCSFSLFWKAYNWEHGESSRSKPIYFCGAWICLFQAKLPPWNA